MTHIEAMKLALEALNKLTDAAGGFSVSGVYFNEGVWEQECLNAAYDAIKALEEALAKQEQKEDFFKQIGDQSMMQLWQNYCDVKVERDELQEKLAKQEQGEPVSTPPANCRQRLKADGKVYGRSNCQVCGSMAPKWKECDAALLTTPQQRKPLTDEQVDEAVDAWFKPDADGNFSSWRERMRAAIEAAHGITSATDFKE